MNMKTIKALPTKVLILLAAAFVLAGCATKPIRPVPQPQPQPKPEPQRPGQATPLPPQQSPEVSRPPKQQQPSRPSQPAPARKAKQINSPAVMALLGSADTLARSGHMKRAAATLERALNIEPRNPFVYQRLAAVRLAQEQYSQAKALAHKSNSLAVSNPFIRADNWVLIAQANRMTGNQTGYRKAKAKVEKYRLRSARYK